MKKLMVLVVLLAVALIAAPAIAQNETTNPPPDGAPGDDPEAALPKASQEAPFPKAALPEAPAPEAPAPEAPAPETPSDDGDLAQGTGDDVASNSPGPGDDAVITDTGDDTSTGDAGGRDAGTVEDDKDTDDEVIKDEIDDADAEDRKDRIADRILADLKDDKKDKDDNDAKDGKKDKDDNDDGVEQSTDQDADSGDVDQDADVINTGDNVNQCVGILQVANTGNAQNATGVTQYDSESDEIELENGSRITLTPQLVVDCRQIILQIVQGERPNESKLSKARLREVIQPRGGAAQAVRTGAGVIVPSSRSGITATPKVLSASSAGRPAGQQLKTSARSLPRTGGPSGYATLLGLGAGTLLVGGGLLVRRLAR